MFYVYFLFYVKQIIKWQRSQVNSIKVGVKTHNFSVSGYAGYVRVVVMKTNLERVRVDMKT